MEHNLIRILYFFKHKYPGILLTQIDALVVVILQKLLYLDDIRDVIGLKFDLLPYH
jgi:hypothetical protein